MDYDYKKRDYLLPQGCKDLIDVLRLPAGETGDSVLSFIRGMLLQAEGANATEILLAPPILGDGYCFIMQRINRHLCPVANVLADFRSSILARLLQMADLSEATFPVRGVATLQLKERQLRWNLHIESPGAECQLTPCDA